MNIQKLRNIYDAIEIKDMSFEAFCHGYMEATRPPTPQEILGIRMEQQFDKARCDSKKIITL